MDPLGHKKRLFDNIVSLYLLQGLNYIIPMAVLPYLVRVLGMEVYGLMAFSQAFAQYFVIFTDYGFNLSATRHIAQHRTNAAEIRRMFWQVLIVKAALMLVGILALIAIVLAVPRFHQNSLFFFLSYIAVAGNVLFPQWYFQGIEKMRYISALTGGMKIVSAIFLFLFVHSPADGARALMIQSLGILGSGVAGFAIAFKAVGLERKVPSVRELRRTMQDGWSLFISTAAVSLYTNTNLVLVGLLAGNVQAGYFSAAEKLIRAMVGLIGPVTQAIFPHINAVAARSKEEALRTISKAVRWMGGISFLSSMALWLLAGMVTRICFGPAVYEGSTPVVRWIAFLPFLISLSNVLGIQTMLTFGLDKEFSRILMASGLWNVLLGIPLVKYFGAQGAGATVLLTEIAVTVTMLVTLQQKKIYIFQPEGATS